MQDGGHTVDRGPCYDEIDDRVGPEKHIFASKASGMRALHK